MTGLSGKVALVTGGTSGIGIATVEAFLNAGCSVMFSGRNTDKANSALKRLGDKESSVEYRLGDISEADFCEQLVDATIARFGRLDIVFNGAGVIHRGDALATDDNAWRWTMGTNVDGTFFVSRAAARTMCTSATEGAIINVSSTVGMVGCKGLTAYCVSKGAVLQLTRAMALDHAADNITVNAICPGAVDTPMLVSGHAESVTETDVMKANTAEIPQGRIAKAEEVAAVAVFLAGARHITGAAIPVDGGYTAK